MIILSSDPSFSLNHIGCMIVLFSCLGCSGASVEETELRHLMAPSNEHLPTSLTPNLTPRYDQLTINEINSRLGENDWIEVANIGEQPLDLTGCFLSDDPDFPLKSIITSGMQIDIPPKGYLVIHITEATLGFKLGKSDSILISSPSGDLIQRVDYHEGQYREGELLARLPDLYGSFMASSMPTPNASNKQAPLPHEDYQNDDLTTLTEEEYEDTHSDRIPEPPLENEPSQDDDEEDQSLNQEPISPHGSLVINEVAAKGDPEDWIELYNVSEQPVSLAGLGLTDSLEEVPFTFDERYPPLEAHSFMLIEVSNETTGFKLGKDEAVYILDESGDIVDSIDWEDGDSPEGGSLARIPDGQGSFATVETPSPGQSNQ